MKLLKSIFDGIMTFIMGTIVLLLVLASVIVFLLFTIIFVVPCLLLLSPLLLFACLSPSITINYKEQTKEEECSTQE